MTGWRKLNLFLGDILTVGGVILVAWAVDHDNYWAGLGGALVLLLGLEEREARRR